MVIVGWSFGILEAICVTVLVGLAVDYVTHMGPSHHATNVAAAAPITRFPSHPFARTLNRINHGFLSLSPQ